MLSMQVETLSHAGLHRELPDFGRHFGDFEAYRIFRISELNIGIDVKPSLLASCHSFLRKADSRLRCRANEGSAWRHHAWERERECTRARMARMARVTIMIAVASCHTLCGPSAPSMPLIVALTAIVAVVLAIVVEIIAMISSNQ